MQSPAVHLSVKTEKQVLFLALCSPWEGGKGKQASNYDTLHELPPGKEKLPWETLAKPRPASWHYLPLRC